MNRFLFVILIFWATIINIYGQNSYVFTHLATRATQINSIVKDKNGVVWFGTSVGLMRWMIWDNTIITDVTQVLRDFGIASVSVFNIFG